jgi:hypothetical protein
MPEIISRKEAIAQGLKRYFTGKPCVNGHDCERYISGCMMCAMESAKRWDRKNPERRSEVKQQWRIKNREKAALSNRRHRLKNPQNNVSRNRERNQKISDLLTVLRTEMPELLKEFGL